MSPVRTAITDQNLYLKLLILTAVIILTFHLGSLSSPKNLSNDTSYMWQLTCCLLPGMYQVLQTVLDSSVYQTYMIRWPLPNSSINRNKSYGSYCLIHHFAGAYHITDISWFIIIQNTSPGVICYQTIIQPWLNNIIIQNRQMHVNSPCHSYFCQWGYCDT